MHNHNHDNHSHHLENNNALGNIKIAFFLNLCFSLLEFLGGIWTNSTAIMADALHDLGDALSLCLAYVLTKKASSKADQHFSYGYGRFSLTSAAVTAIILVVGSVTILAQSIPRLFNPVTPKSLDMIGISIIGILINGFMAWRLHKGHSINEKLISWHLLEDVLGWSITLVVAIIMLFWEIPILDPILSIVFTIFILKNVLKNFIQTANLFLQGVPSNLSLATVSDQISKVNGIQGIHDLHLWSLDGQRHVLTVHAVVAPDTSISESWKIKQQIRNSICSLGNIHATIEIEWDGNRCEIDCMNP